MPVSSDVGSKLLAWIAAGAGTLLAYSAFKNRSPLDVLRDIEGPPAFQTASSGGAQPSGFRSGSFSTSVPRIRMIANREIPPELVRIRPSGRLDKDAAASLERIHARVGTVVPNVGSYRSFVEQAAAFYDNNETLADGSKRYGNPNKSLHVVGLAIDVRNDFASKPEVVQAFASEGWHRPRPDVEPWHYSYLVRG